MDGHRHSKKKICAIKKQPAATRSGCVHCNQGAWKLLKISQSTEGKKRTHSTVLRLKAVLTSWWCSLSTNVAGSHKMGHRMGLHKALPHSENTHPITEHTHTHTPLRHQTQQCHENGMDIFILSTSHDPPTTSWGKKKAMQENEQEVCVTTILIKRKTASCENSTLKVLDCCQPNKCLKHLICLCK